MCKRSLFHAMLHDGQGIMRIEKLRRLTPAILLSLSWNIKHVVLQTKIFVFHFLRPCDCKQRKSCLDRHGGPLSRTCPSSPRSGRHAYKQSRRNKQCIPRRTARTGRSGCNLISCLAYLVQQPTHTHTLCSQIGKTRTMVHTLFSSLHTSADESKNHS